MSKAKLACKCKSISDSVLGDGCDICNPEKAKDVAYERIEELEQQLSTLRYAMKKIATGEHSNPALAAKRALKERDNE